MAETSTAGDDWRGPCASIVEVQDRRAAAAADRVSWDLDVGDAASWMRATRICVEECPFLSRCRALLEQAYPGKTRPVGVIWAGLAYSELGRPLSSEGLRRLSAVRRNSMRATGTANAAAC